MSHSTPVLEPVEIDSTGSGGRGWIVTVYNNEKNTYDEVITILMVATECTFDEAYMETWEVDKLGRSVVHLGGEEECNEVASVIAEIGIRVEVSED
ncbi:hypothetical protein BH11ARM1_BH11ARM1_01810 [soil metagenome]